MARGPVYGMDLELSRKLNAKYDTEAEAVVVAWINGVLPDAKLPTGRKELQTALKSGIVLVQLMNALLAGSASLTEEAQKIKLPMNHSTMSSPFKQMENIEKFLNATTAYGVAKSSLFQTVDLFEGRNMGQVLTTLMQLGTECQRCGFNGPVCGPKPAQKNQRNFTPEQLRSSDGVIGLQMGLSQKQSASQSGMTFGAHRHIINLH